MQHFPKFMTSMIPDIRSYIRAIRNKYLPVAPRLPAQPPFAPFVPVNEKRTLQMSLPDPPVSDAEPEHDDLSGASSEADIESNNGSMSGAESSWVSLQDHEDR